MTQKSKLKVTHGKNGVAEMPAIADHLRDGHLVVYCTTFERERLVTRAKVAYRISDADERSN